jgi:hypothetical protein
VNEDGTVRLATNPPSIGQTWADMEKVLASGKVKACLIWLMVGSGLKFLSKRISVSPISQLKRVIDVSIICNIIN